MFVYYFLDFTTLWKKFYQLLSWNSPKKFHKIGNPSGIIISPFSLLSKKFKILKISCALKKLWTQTFKKSWVDLNWGCVKNAFFNNCTSCASTIITFTSFTSCSCVYIWTITKPTPSWKRTICYKIVIIKKFQLQMTRSTTHKLLVTLFWNTLYKHKARYK